MEKQHELLDQPLIKFSDNPSDWWTIRNAVTGVQILGGIGSGKSSGSGKTLAYSFLKNGFGGIVLTGKVDETETWLRYAEEMDRLDDVIIFGAKRPKKDGKDKYKHLRNKEYKFNPLHYMTENEGSGKTENIVSLFTSIIKIGDRISGSGEGSSTDPFWDRALQRAVKSAVDLLKLARKGATLGKSETAVEWELKDSKWENSTSSEDENFGLTIANISKIIRQAPIAGREISEDNYTIECLAYAKEAALELDDISTNRIYEVVENYFMTDFATMPEKTRGSVLETFYSFANPFRSGMLADYFSTETSEEIKPEVTFGNKNENGKIIILDFPIKEYLELGIYAQAIYKKLWQQTVERRKVKKNTTPVFIWVDESQFFLSEDDMLFQTTARSSRACTVMISQNISNYYAAIGGQNAEARVNSLLGNLSTKIFHANNDYVTNEWAANTIGRTFQSQMNVNVGDKRSTSLSRALHYQIEPQAFTLLRNGGELNQSQVDGIVTVSGKVWSNGKNFIQTYFYQNNQLINNI